MPDSFFSQFFEPPSQGPTTAERKPEAKREPPKEAPPQPAPLAPKPEPALSEKMASLETELAKAKERALSYELRIKEMENARANVEDMFEKLWAKASKEKMEEELRLVRERSIGRVEALEKRLDEFQKGFLDLLRDWRGAPPEAKPKPEPQSQPQPKPQPQPQLEDIESAFNRIEAILNKGLKKKEG